MMSSRMTAEEEESVQRELAAMQAEQVNEDGCPVVLDYELILQVVVQDGVQLPDAPQQQPITIPSPPSQEPQVPSGAVWRCLYASD